VSELFREEAVRHATRRLAGEVMLATSLPGMVLTALAVMIDPYRTDLVRPKINIIAAPHTTVNIEDMIKLNSGISFSNATQASILRKLIISMTLILLRTKRS
jgi:hypothetical protein